jgi:hypothetical protein
MLGLWLQDIESLEAISQDDGTRQIFLRMASMSQAGTLTRFIDELGRDPELDEETKRHVAELAQDEVFLLAVADYVRETRVFH